ncbi:RyR domain-containing protein [Maritalea sp.]|uniref:RyR domain-containing protein n=1 Tax=Maritalea sp. TaxID=2003361 RepID=UPI003EF302DE
MGRSIVWAAFLALTLSFVGNLQKNFRELPLEEQNVSRSAKIVLDTIPVATKVFSPMPRTRPGTEGWLLTIAETLGSVVTFAAVQTVLWSILREQAEKLRISILRRHTILLGFDERARLFMKSKQRPRDRTVVVVDPTASSKVREKAHAAGCLHYATTEDVELTKQLQACRATRATRIILSTGSDSANLEYIKEIAKSDFIPPKDVLMIIEDVKLHQQLEENDGFMQKLGEDTALRMINPAKSAAIDLLSRVNFNAIALDLGQDRATLVVFGATNVAAEVVSHFLRVSPSVLPEVPKICWVVEEKAELQRLLSLDYAALVALVSYPSPSPDTPLTWAISIEVFETGKDTALYDENKLGTFKHALTEATAVIVAEDPERFPKTNIQIGTALRQTSRRLTCLEVPIFLHSEKKSAEDEFLICTNYAAVSMPYSQKNLSKTDRLSEVIEPFGRSDEVYNWGDEENSREALAQRLHAEYLADRKADPDTEYHRTASKAPWNVLAETYKNANRRAADQLRSLGFSKDLLLSKTELETQAVVERLAALEHDAWWIDRELDGWRYHETRDNTRKFHPNLIPYDELSTEIQEYDRAKVRWVLDRTARQARA